MSKTHYPIQIGAHVYPLCGRGYGAKDVYVAKWGSSTVVEEVTCSVCIKILRKAVGTAKIKEDALFKRYIGDIISEEMQENFVPNIFMKKG